MATIKHLSSKNSNYAAAESYLTFQHNEYTGLPILDEKGRPKLRDSYLLDTLECGESSFAMACLIANRKYGKNGRREDVKTHHYIVSFDPKDAVENGLTMERAQALYAEAPRLARGHEALQHSPDHAALADIAKRHDLLLIVDNTFLSPYFQNPLNLGADIVVHSGTKFLGGHNDTLAGFLVTNREDISEKLHFLIKTTGSGLAPFDSWLILRGIKTLGIRMEQAQKNAFKIAEWLKTQKAVTRVIYPGLPEQPGHEIMKKLI